MTEHPTLAGALVAALAELTVIEKGHTADAGTYKYDYADLPDTVKLTRPALAEHGIVALTPVHGYEGGLACTVILIHTSGERMDFDPLTFPRGNTAQATGSAITYARRYALTAALGMAAGDDDDGAAATIQQEHVRDEVPCRQCGELVQGARSDREPMRVHMIEAHGWVRQDDGTAAPPKDAGPPSGVDESGSPQPEPGSSELPLEVHA